LIYKQFSRLSGTLKPSNTLLAIATNDTLADRREFLQTTGIGVTALGVLFAAGPAALAAEARTGYTPPRDAGNSLQERPGHGSEGPIQEPVGVAYAR
jgi:hypothetical protein